METLVVRMFRSNVVKNVSNKAIVQFSLRRCHSENPRKTPRGKKIHPYRNIHPWNSIEKFAKSLVTGIIHNEDGLVVINKPYGISGKAAKHEERRATGIVKDVDYSVEEALPLIAAELKYPSLNLVKAPERFTSGVTILADSKSMTKLIEKSLERAQGMSMVPTTYWAVTTRVAREMKGEKRLAMRMVAGPEDEKKMPIIIETWSQTEQKRRDIKILNVQFRVLSNSAENLASLVEIKSSTKKWHALRLFASTVLYSPILGDNIYGSRTQFVLGRWVNISPFVDAAHRPPHLNRELLHVLKLSPDQQSTIPTHLHLREILLPMFPTKDRDLVLTAPLMPEFDWTCRQLKFKHKLFDPDMEDNTKESDNSEPARSRTSLKSKKTRDVATRVAING